MENKDVKVIYKLEEECFSVPWSEKSIAKEVDNLQSLFCVYEEADEVVAYAGMYLIGNEGDITNVAVRGDFRRCGIGRRLLSEMFEIARKEGISEFTLEVRESNNAAIKLYEKLGFRTEGVRKNFYDKPKENALIMWKR